MALLERVSEADQARGPGRTSKGAVVVATSPTHPRPGLVPGQQGYEADGSCYVPLLESTAERFWNAMGAGAEDCPTPVLGEAHRLPDQAGKVNSFSGGERHLQQDAGWHLAVDGDVCDDRTGRAKRFERLDVARDDPRGHC